MLSRQDAPKSEPKKHSEPAYDEFDREPAIESEPIDEIIDEEIVSVDELAVASFGSPIPSDADIDAAIEAGRIVDDEIETVGAEDGVEDLGDEIERVQITEARDAGRLQPAGGEDFHPAFHDDQPRRDDRGPGDDRGGDRGPRDRGGRPGRRSWRRSWRSRRPRRRSEAGAIGGTVEDAAICGDRGLADRSDRGDRGGTPRRRPSAAGNRMGGRDQGRAGSRPGVSRPKPLIQDVFRRGQEVLVQVIKEGIGTKGPTLSTYISIAGRYLVLMPGLNRVGVSRKIEDAAGFAVGSATT